MATRRYPKPPEPKRHFVSPRAQASRVEAKATITYIRVGSVERPSSRGYKWHDGYSENGNTYPWLTKREAQRDAASRGARAVFVEKQNVQAREAAGHRVADFNTLDDLIAHARQEGATHVEWEHGTQGTRLYFPRKDGQYEAANTWQKAGYWHAQGPGSREIIRHLPPGVQSLGGPPRGHSVRDYPHAREETRIREGEDEEEAETWIDAPDNEAPWLAQHWYSGQGDPLYALSSAGFPQPESTVQWALRNAKESETFQWKEMEKKYGKKGIQKLMAIDPESREARDLPDEKREDLEATDEISRLVYALQEALNHGERISSEEGWAKHGR